MTKEECVRLVDAHRTAWNMDPATKDVYETWWRYFENRDYDAALEALDWFVAKAGYPPRVADVFRRTVDVQRARFGLEVPLHPAEALAQANALVDANNRGVETPEVSTFVMDTMKALVKKRIPWSPKVFTEEYEQVVTEHYFGAR